MADASSKTGADISLKPYRVLRLLIRIGRLISILITVYLVFWAIDGLHGLPFGPSLGSGTSPVDTERSLNVRVPSLPELLQRADGDGEWIVSGFPWEVTFRIEPTGTPTLDDAFEIRNSPAGTPSEMEDSILQIARHSRSRIQTNSGCERIEIRQANSCCSFYVTSLNGTERLVSVRLVISLNDEFHLVLSTRPGRRDGDHSVDTPSMLPLPVECSIMASRLNQQRTADMQIVTCSIPLSRLIDFWNSHGYQFESDSTDNKSLMEYVCLHGGSPVRIVAWSDVHSRDVFVLMLRATRLTTP